MHPFTQQTMNNQIRITSDGRGEVSIELRRQTKVTNVFSLVHRLLHRAQCNGAYQSFFRSTCHRLYCTLNFRRVHFFLYFEFHVEVGKKLCQLLHFIFCRNVVDTVNERPFLLEHVLSNSFVCSQHKFFNNRFRIAMNTLHNFNWL